SIHEPALVFVENSGPYLMHLNPYSANVPMLDGRILFAADNGAENIDLIATTPDRTPLLERTTDPAWDDPVGYHDAPAPKVSLIPLRVLHGRSATLRMRATSRGAPVVEAYLRVNNRVVDRRVLATNAKAGQTFETDWTVGWPGSPDVASGAAFPLDKETGTV